MRLSKTTLPQLQPQPGHVLPSQEQFELPEKVLQFGTGVLLRGLPDYFIDKANRQHLFNGRIVVVKSTSTGSSDAFDRQDGLYTLCIKGLEQDQLIEESIINASISRVLSASDSWNEILQTAHNPAMQLIISNTTEMGIVLADDALTSGPPGSFPGKLTAWLLERFNAFQGDASKGMVIIPTELITDNGSTLRSIVLELAARQSNIDPAFIDWLKQHNHFCNSLVDRIVPGKLPEADHAAIESRLGYQDELLIMAESFRLWAIETNDERVRKLLSFATADTGVVIAPDISRFRELKLRLLNGTHTFSSGLAVLAGFESVKQAMSNDAFEGYVKQLMREELAPATQNDQITLEQALEYSDSVLDRFRNPFLHHRWLSITLNFTSKMRLRNIPLLIRKHRKDGVVPGCMSLGFAAFLLFMRCSPTADGIYVGKAGGQTYTVQDEQASYFSHLWEAANADALVVSVLSNVALWGLDLSTLDGLIESVSKDLHQLIQEGASAVIVNREYNK